MIYSDLDCDIIHCTGRFHTFFFFVYKYFLLRFPLPGCSVIFIGICIFKFHTNSRHTSTRPDIRRAKIWLMETVPNTLRGQRGYHQRKVDLFRSSQTQNLHGVFSIRWRVTSAARNLLKYFRRTRRPQ